MKPSITITPMTHLFLSRGLGQEARHKKLMRHNLQHKSKIMSLKKIGLVGGLSWVSTAEYYRLINEGVRSCLGGYHSAHILMDSLNEQEFIDAAIADPTDKKCEALVLESVERLKNAGAEIFALCANGVHRFEPAIKQELGVEILNIAKATSEAISQTGHRRVGILGVQKTMEGNFYREQLQAQGIELIIPEQPDREIVHQKIMDELVLGNFREETRQLYYNICQHMHRQGAESIILGCTEIPLLMANMKNSDLILHSTTELHCHAIVKAAVREADSI
ncbi:aspartate/glutamate racemase family protein [Endozoicomonadaceae bacterium StTr2]